MNHQNSKRGGRKLIIQLQYNETKKLLIQMIFREVFLPLARSSTMRNVYGVDDGANNHSSRHDSSRGDDSISDLDREE